MVKADLPLLENRVTFLTHRINARLQQVSHPVISPVGLDLYSSRILFALDQNGPMKVGQLVELMALPQSTLSHQLKRMEKNGLVTRTRSDHDNRTVEVAATDQGIRATRVCTALSDAIAERLNAALEPTEMKALIDGLNRIFDALADMPTLAERCAELVAER
ncbi:MAG: MarR family transcriptional regulator [Rhodobacter sp.]|uniref:MarR family winged helix-turn-helix transcriptional regulator n=1 Tax=Pararhodobacter sp. TaxID=2127056 RepID=UPI001D44479D|nr:MarR family transcriptional regulator [Pararhodobacter sp.]MCB1344881.1 MarR family transcriptional regulator [Paracoccaceae bacterium]MCC0074464.1 MarR family transcriptional regulator [Rhodobacter sp.]HPD93391.1 MarR family transcriptional regulator [Pararhodobacter sp.]